MKRSRLKRELGLFQVTIAGVGIILGAGIYALIGVAAGVAGNAVWLSFLISAIIAAFTGLSYAELSSIFKKDSGEYEYCESAFGAGLASFVSILVIFTGIVSASTVAIGFGGYFASLFPGPIALGIVLLVLAMTFINFYGIKETNKFNFFATIIELFGLLIIIALGFRHFGNVDIFSIDNGFSGIFQGAALAFFAYMGFEMIVKLGEETKDPQKTIPRAIVLSVIITSIVYVLVAIAAVNMLPVEALASSESPLADAAAQSFGGSTAFFVLAFIALFSTANTVLMTMVMTSRMVYGLSNEKQFPSFLAEIHPKRKTPHIAVLFIGFFTIIFATIGSIDFVASITTLLLFATFGFVNLAVIILRYKNKTKRKFRMPLNIGNFPIIALLGVLTSIIMMFYSLINLF